MAISGSKDIQIPYGMEIFSTSEKSVRIERNPDNPSQARLNVQGDLIVQGKARFSQGDLTISGSAFSSGGWQPLFIDDSDAVSLDTGSFHYTLDSAAGSVTIGVRQEDMFQILKPKIELAPTFNKGVDYPKTEDFRFITKFGQPYTGIRYELNRIGHDPAQSAGQYDFRGDSIFVSLTSSAFDANPTQTQSYGSIITSNVLSETLSNVVYFEPNAGSLFQGSVDVSVLYDAEPSGQDVQDYASLVSAAISSVTSSSPYVGESSFHTFHSSGSSSTSSDSHINNIYKITPGNRYTFVFADKYFDNPGYENVPRPPLADPGDPNLPTPVWTD